MSKLAVLFAITFTCLSSGPSLADDVRQQAQSAAASRFLVSDKGEAYDKETHLTWQRCSVGTTWKSGAGCIGQPKLMSLKDAKRFAEQVGEGWRVPTIDELYSLVEQEYDDPAINSVVFPNVKESSEGAPYWTVTPIDEMPMLIYFVDFMTGRVDGHTEGFSLAVRLVRSGE
ncbi:MAG: DUF1566 domain-containing protein [Oceanospirillales bacterium]|nr:DUF1566 domain-containing protein [Oceanospirillales bacterium]